MTKNNEDDPKNIDNLKIEYNLKNGHMVAIVRASPKPTKYRQKSVSVWIVFHWRSSSIKCCLPSKVVFHRRSSSIEGHLPSKVVFHQRSSSIKGHLPSKVVFHWRLSSINGRHPSKVVFHQKSCSTCWPGLKWIKQLKARSFRQRKICDKLKHTKSGWPFCGGYVTIP